MTLFSKPPMKPCVSLCAYQYLCLKIATNPNQSSVWYLKQLSRYLEGTPSIIDDYGFFFYGAEACNWEDLFTNKHKGEALTSSYTVTDEGMNVAKRAAQQIGLTLP